MSQLNGDKARSQRLRKAGLLRRDKARAAYAEMKRQAALKGSAPPANEPAVEARARVETLDPAKHEAAGEQSALELSRIAQTPGDTRPSI